VIEDDPDIGNLLASSLVGPGIEVRLERDSQGGLGQAARGVWDLYIIDRMLAGVDGIGICRHIRARDQAAAVIFLTARDSEIDRVEGLDAGADDYVAKPFSIDELQARVRAQLRRRRGSGTAGAVSDEQCIRIGSLQVDGRSRAAELRGQSLALTGREFQLLHFFMRHPDRAWTREQLLQKIWGPGFDGFAHTVNSHINRLRAKLEPDPANPTLIVTVWGAGYRLVAHGVE
jgi:DNA-binding response OmpR family regulator